MRRNNIENFSFVPRIADSKSLHLDQQIINKISLLVHFLKAQGYRVQTYSQKGLEKLSLYSVEKKEKALEQLEKLNWLYSTPIHNPEIDVPETPDNRHPEMHLVNLALGFYNLELRDDFWATVDPHDILEIYNDESLQLFRTFNFFETSGYSLTDLLINEWYVLWERPKFILQEVFKYSDGILSGNMQGVIKMTIPEHIVKEIYNGTDEMLDFTPRSLIVQFGNICALYDSENKEDKKVKGIIVSSRCVTNTMGREETKKVVIF